MMCGLSFMESMKVVTMMVSPVIDPVQETPPVVVSYHYHTSTGRR